VFDSGDRLGYIYDMTGFRLQGYGVGVRFAGFGDERRLGAGPSSSCEERARRHLQRLGDLLHTATSRQGYLAAFEARYIRLPHVTAEVVDPLRQILLRHSQFTPACLD